MGIMVYSSLCVMQDLYHQPYLKSGSSSVVEEPPPPPLERPWRLNFRPSGVLLDPCGILLEPHAACFCAYSLRSVRFSGERGDRTVDRAGGFCAFKKRHKSGSCSPTEVPAACVCVRKSDSHQWHMQKRSRSEKASLTDKHCSTACSCPLRLRAPDLRHNDLKLDTEIKRNYRWGV